MRIHTHIPGLVNLRVQNVLMCAHQDSLTRNFEVSKQYMCLFECFIPVCKGFKSFFFFACTQKLFAVNLMWMKDARLIALGTEFLCIQRTDIAQGEKTCTPARMPYNTQLMQQSSHDRTLCHCTGNVKNTAA